MKKYKINEEYSILSAFPHSFQISSKTSSYRLVDHQDDPEAEYPHEITLNMDSANRNHILLYTPRKYMRIVWYDDPDEPNGQIDMGIRTPDAELDFVSWLTLANGIPQEVIFMAYLILTSPESVAQYEVPLFQDVPKNTTSNNNNDTMPPPPPPPKPNSTLKKKRKFKVRTGGASTQRRLRSF